MCSTKNNKHMKRELIRTVSKHNDYDYVYEYETNEGTKTFVATSDVEAMYNREIDRALDKKLKAVSSKVVVKIG